MAVADPSQPTVPQPLNTVDALAFVARSLKLRVENITSYVLSLHATVAANAAAPVAYTLPVASAVVLGGVKIDGSSVTITDGVLSALVGAPATTLPVVDGTAAVGLATKFARADHVHPTDTSRYAAANPANYVSKTYVDTMVAAAWAAIAKPPVAKTYIFHKPVAAATWVVLHNLSQYPAVEVVDTSGNVIDGDIHYDSANQITLHFSAAFAGTAYLN